ncbi:COG4223 family protein [Ketogulonicigenium vulgare]|uniref:Mitochondrial inner membrane protein n=1 Tax=Ketogulonicigenium vulgare (strain WSH-001) TaxID=759362 RepID=F9Y5U4_KETVW|nr:hypothetical protein [Ketogulonicigenium vulgare]ADO43754.1 conserved hypothetical protein [Ketogulonicigenium vulgare Y25]AEM42019.1 hypothetical protein KVU_2180 [Ketogulonicigenium vulgare WSH-001]ALJ82114.1 hypothetical protein KVH_13650 [Ketogulonicigenium vulgare]ANW34739.1 hypothetical protein KvSKV_13560 [Ketogulonicigenium vulgare]AOZ55787.1 hypothetical protein KVC_2785 [Ketogulonicigenium vulgare]
MPDPEIKQDEAVLPPAPARDPAPSDAPKPVDEVAPKKASAAVPLVLAGVVAAALGYGAAYLGLGMQFSPLAQRMSAIEADLAARPDPSAALDALRTAVEAQGAAQTDMQTALADQIAAAIAPVAAQIEAFESRLNTAEAAPSGAPIDTSAFTAEIDALREQLAAQGAQLQDFASARATEVAEATQTAVAAATAAASDAQQRLIAATQDRLRAAIDSGAGFAAALADLQAEGVAIPPALQNIETVPTLAQLQDDFPAAARAALVAERGSESGLMGFLQNRFNLRSVAPREGTDADAVLSRAGAAVATGDLTAALAEVASLPPGAQAAMAEWTGAAQARLDAEAAVAAISPAE